MADLTHITWKQQDSLNNSPPPEGAPEGMLAGQIDAILRNMKGATSRFFDRINPMVTSTNTGNAYSIVYDQGPPSYVKGETFAFFISATNTGPATLKIGSLLARALVRSDGKPLQAGDLLKDQACMAYYDGNAFRLYSPTLSDSPTFTGTISGNGVSAVLRPRR